MCMCECVGARVWGVAVGVNGAGRAGLSEQGTLTSTPAGGEGMSSTCEAQSESMSAMRKSVSLPFPLRTIPSITGSHGEM